MGLSARKNGSTELRRRRARETRQTRKAASSANRGRGVPETGREEVPRYRYRLLWW